MEEVKRTTLYEYAGIFYTEAGQKRLIKKAIKSPSATTTKDKPPCDIQFCNRLYNNLIMHASMLILSISRIFKAY